MNTPSINKPYIHEKGGVYYPMFIVQNKDYDRLDVVYKSEGKDGRLYVRSLKNFNLKFSPVKESE